MLRSTTQEDVDIYNTFFKDWHNRKYLKYYIGSYRSWDRELDKDDYYKIDFTSVNKKGQVIGTIRMVLDRPRNIVSNLAVVNLTKVPQLELIKDLIEAIDIILTEYNFRKINFWTVEGSHLEKRYDRLVSRFNGRIVGIQKEENILYDGTICDIKVYEVLREGYLKSKDIQ